VEEDSSGGEVVDPKTALPTGIDPEIKNLFTKEHDIRMIALEHAEQGHSGSSVDKARSHVKAAAIIEHYILTGGTNV